METKVTICLWLLISVQFFELRRCSFSHQLLPFATCTFSKLHVQDFGDHKIHVQWIWQVQSTFVIIEAHVCWPLLHSYHVELCLFLTDIQPSAPYHCKYMQITGNLLYTRVTVYMYGVPLLCSLQAVVLSSSTAIHKCCKGRNISTVIHKCWNHNE